MRRAASVAVQLPARTPDTGWRPYASRRYARRDIVGASTTVYPDDMFNKVAYGLPQPERRYPVSQVGWSNE
jgi:hypothetical protein